MDGLNGLLWVLAIILAIVFVVIGLVLVRDDPGGKRRLGWAEGTPQWRGPVRRRRHDLGRAVPCHSAPDPRPGRADPGVARSSWRC